MNHHHNDPISTNQGTLSVKKCVCGGVHISIGAISINLAASTASHLLAQLSSACEETNKDEIAPGDEAIVRSLFPRYLD